MRTCVACREEAGKGELVRLTRGPDGRVVVDLTGRTAGRGAYLHRAPHCVEVARRRGALARALKAEVPAETWSQLGLD